MEISKELVAYLEDLGRMRLTEEEQIKTMKDLGAILDYVNKLEELDTTGVEPLSHAMTYTNIFREDRVTDGEKREDVLSNAPQQKNGCYKVPKTVE